MARRNEPDKDHQKTSSAPTDPGRRNALKTGLTGAATLTALAAASLPAGAQDATDSLLSGQTALITGAARGIGRAIAIAYAKAGADVAALDIADPDAYRDVLGYELGSQEELDETIALIEAEGRRAIGIKADVTAPGAMPAAVDRVLDTFGGLDIFVANAGVGGGGRLQDVSEAHWKTVLDINLTGAASGMAAVLPPMIEHGAGRIIAITSVAGRMGAGGQTDYAASKWGMVGLVKSAAMDAGPHGITVNAVAPTGVRTGIFGDFVDNQEWMAGFDALMQQLHTLPVGMLEPEDMAGTAVFLASPAAQYISGAVIDVAAGMNARYTG